MELVDNGPIPVMLTIKETSEKFNLPEHFCRNLVWQKKITYVKGGKKYLINEKSLIDYLNAGEHPATKTT